MEYTKTKDFIYLFKKVLDLTQNLFDLEKVPELSW